ncbi:MAG: cupredoxin domain-containing protein [Candidatus Methanoperedens sp.]|nr:cupredoxin domain-containing protein [Candidatus Methanoperedens sp.]MCZ7369068.1 cupredoxin domain-containing protein [Candidatus Methanoperedens sp.]
MEKKLVIGFLVLIVLLSGCAGPSTTTTPTSQPTTTQPAPTQTLTASPTQTLTASPTLTAQPVAVEIKSFAFVPATVTIAIGTTVVWTQEDSGVSHTVTGTGFDSGPLSQGETFNHTFDQAGTFNYGCSIHPTMTGTIIAK